MESDCSLKIKATSDNLIYSQKDSAVDSDFVFKKNIIKDVPDEILN